MAQILFVVPMTEQSIRQEVNGTLLLATRLLEAGFDTRILRFCQIERHGGDYGTFIRDIVGQILDQDPRCVSFYGLWPNYHTILRIARELKARNPRLITVLGGPQASATAAATMARMDFVDYICTGEGENTVVPFFTALLREDGTTPEAIPGVYYRADGKVCACTADNPLCELDEEPFWDDRLYRELYAQPDDRLRSDTYYMPLDVGRGCPYSCTFCCTSHFWRRTYRMKSPQRILEDMKFYNEKFGIRSFLFSHDAFTIDHQLVSQVCDRILEEGLDFRWKCTTRVDCITEELVLKMKQAGARRIDVGIETGSPRMQKRIRKNLDLKKARHMIEFMLRNGLRVSMFFMHGFPEETEEDLAQTLNFLFDMMDLGVAQTPISICCFSPTTALTEQYLDELIFDPSMTILFRGFYGDEEDLQMIRENKEIFPMYYDLPRPLRRDYQHLRSIVRLYEKLRKSMRLLRQLYGRDDLRMCRDFCSCNRHLLTQNADAADRYVDEEPLTLVENMLRDFDSLTVRRILGLMRFELDLEQVRRSPGDLEIRRVYEFNYIDLTQKRPLDRYSPGSTEILLRSRSGKPELQVLRFLM